VSLKFKNQDELLERIKKSLPQHCGSEECVAVFDADGTLWEEDANQILLDYQRERFKNRKFEDLFADYYQKYHRHELCELFLKKQEGFSLSEFQDQSEKALDISPLSVFPFQRELLNCLFEKGLKIVVVTASIQWLVELAVKKTKLPVHQVLGCRTELDRGGLISNRIVRPSPGIDSKAEVFLKEYSKTSCFLAAGNTPSDEPLLDLAKLSIIVHSAKKNSLIFEKENQLKDLALKNQWLLFEREKLG